MREEQRFEILAPIGSQVNENEKKCKKSKLKISKIQNSTFVRTTQKKIMTNRFRVAVLRQVPRMTPNDIEPYKANVPNICVISATSTRPIYPIYVLLVPLESMSPKFQSVFLAAQSFSVTGHFDKSALNDPKLL